MSIFDFLRKQASTSPTAVSDDRPAADQIMETGHQHVAPGMTVEMKLRGRNGGGAHEPGLEAAENRLAELQTMYQLGQYSGHPEEMLEDIEFAEHAVRRLRAASPA